MKKLMPLIIGSSVLAIMAYGIFSRNEGLVRSIVVVEWIYFSLQLLISAALLMFISSKEPRKYADSSPKKRSAISWAVSWVGLILMTAQLAYSGWMITAVASAISTLATWFMASVAMSQLEGSDHE